MVLWVRSRGYCDVCGFPMTNQFAVHHRKTGKRADNRPSNLLICHHNCHNGSVDSIHLSPAVAYQNGWMIRGNQLSYLVPVRLHRAFLAMLNDDGTYTRINDNDPTTYQEPSTDDTDGDRATPPAGGTRP
jgi:hypothetical protein